MKYIRPEYTLALAQTNDVVTFSLNFDISDYIEQDKVEYITKPEEIFGVN